MGRIQQKKEIKICPASFGEPVDTLPHVLTAFGVFRSFVLFLLSIVTAVTHVTRIWHTLPSGDEELYRDRRERTSSTTKVYLITRNTCNIV